MDIIVWIGSAFLSVLGIVWSVVWFLISGWVSTLVQIVLLVAAVFVVKYGWQRAPAELWRRGTSLARFSWAWLRAPKTAPALPREPRQTVRIVRIKEPGDVNISTLLSLAALAGLTLLAMVR